MKKSPILLASIPLLVVALVGLGMLWKDGSPLPMRDFVEYYSAGRAFLDHRNPYDPRLLLDLQRGMLNDPAVEQPIMMWNPPWAFVLVAPVATVPPATAHMLWLLAQLAATLASVAMLLSVYRVPKEQWLFGFVAALCFSPFLLLFWYGQIGGFCLLGLAGYLHSEKRKRYLAAGAFAALTALKPHLLFGFGLMLLLDALVSARGRRVLLGGGGAFAVAALVAWLVNPMVYAYYFESIAAPASDIHFSVQDWLQPNFSYRLRMAVAPTHFRVQFVPTLAACAVIAALWLRTRQPVDWPKQLPRMVFVSVLCTAYGAWMFDLVVLLVPVIQAASWLLADRNRSRSIPLALCYLTVNTIAGFAPIVLLSRTGTGLGLHEFIFFSPVILGLYLVYMSWQARDGS